MLKVYCDLCGKEFNNSVSVVSDELYINKIQRILLRFSTPDKIDICNTCRERILNAAKNESKDIRREFENGKQEKKNCAWIKSGDEMRVNAKENNE